MERTQYKYVERLIKKSREVLIVSPYIDLYYANFILHNSKGKKIYIIASSIDNSAKKILANGSFPSLSFALFISFLAASLILFANGEENILFVFAMFFLAIFAIRFKHKRPKNIRLKIPREFVHAKFYIGDSEVITGSANLTFRGMHSNVEHIEIRNDPEYVKTMKKEFWKLWKEA